MVLKTVESILPTNVSPVEPNSRAATNGNKNKTSGLKWLCSVYDTQLDDPFGPLGCFTDPHTCVHTYTSAPTHYLVGSNIVTLCYQFLTSFICMDHLETPFVVILETIKGESTNLKCTFWPTEGVLDHKMNRWYDS